MKTRIIVMSILAVLFSLAAVKANDHQRAKQAERMFVKKQYAAALPLFAQLVSNHPENYKYNYYYGVCILIADKDKSKAVHHLETSLKNPKSPEEVYYYLAKAYHLNYMFDEGIRAIAEFNKIIKASQRAKWKTSEVAECIYSAKKTLDSSKNSQILEYASATASDFSSKYVFEGNYGKILSMPEEYVSKKDDNENPTIFLSADGNIMFYSAYSEITNSRDIFKVVKSTEGTWSAPERMDETINTTMDEIYPTCSADGHVLYFSSMGHHSTGGFDIYKSVYSRVENKWSNAENMGSPYNSPFDDFNFMASASDKICYFTSGRNSDQGQFNVCKNAYAGAQQIPIELKGKFACINAPDLKEATITVTRIDDDAAVATVTTDKTTGLYNVMLPTAGTYKFTVEAAGFQPHSQTATFSEFGETFFNQEIYLSRDQNNAEDMAINNLTEAELARMQYHLTAMEDENGSQGITKADLASQGALAAAGDASGDAAANTGSASNVMEGVEFRVQIGAFKHQTKEESSRKLARKTNNNTMMSNMSDKTWHRFYIGHESSLEKAKELKNVLSKAGFRDAFIVAFKNEQPLSSAEMRNMRKR